MAEGGHPAKRSTSTPGPRARPGFTLIEALLVMLVMAVVLSLAAPSFRDLGNDLQNAAHETAALFRQTRALAMARTAAYRVVVVSDRELRTQFAPTCASGAWETEQRLRVDLPGGVVMQGDSIVPGVALVCYSSRGLGDASPEFVVRDRRGHAHRVEVFTGGAVLVSPVTGGS